MNWTTFIAALGRLVSEVAEAFDKSYEDVMADLADKPHLNPDPNAGLKDEMENWGAGEDEGK